MRGRPKNLAVLAVGFLLTRLGAYNIFLKATWTLLDDGVLWKDTPQGVLAGRLSEPGPAARAGVRVGDVLLAWMAGRSCAAEQVGAHLAQRRSGDTMVYSLLGPTSAARSPSRSARYRRAT